MNMTVAWDVPWCIVW